MEPREELAERRIDIVQAANIVQAAAGGLLALIGMRRGGVVGFAARIAGGLIVLRSLRHVSPFDKMLGTCSGPNPSGIGSEAFRAEAEADIACSREELYRTWRNIENLPAFMDTVLSVRAYNATRSHWVVKGPAGTAVHFDADIINDVPNHLIAWQTLDRTSVVHAGSVRFEPLPDGRTRVRVVMRYDPPAHGLGHAVARMFGADPQQDIERFLARFKEIMETGHVPVGQSARAL